MIRGVRGATTLEEDSLEAHNREVVRLMRQLIKENDIAEPDVLSLFITVTSDLTSISPAKIIRLNFQWNLVPMMCAQEPVIEGLPERCVRILIQFYTTKTPREIRHVYLNGATRLRPDL